MEIRLDSKVALITGATSGIGLATAEVFSKSGAKLVLTGRKGKVLEEIRETISTRADNCVIISGDLTDTAFREKLIGEVNDSYGQLDVLVNSAGIIGNGTIKSTTLEDFDSMLDINLRSVFHLTQLAVPLLEKTRGSIVNVSSVAGIRAFPNILAYCVSKAGLDQLTRVTALELAEKGIRVNAVNPGVVITNLHRRSGVDEASYQKFLEHSKKTHPLGGPGKPEEIADLILFLASEKSGWITGGTYSIDGGRHQTCAR